MSSPSSSQSEHARALASSSRSPLSASQGEDDYSDDGLEIQNEELLADDPLNENGGPNERFSFPRKEQAQDKSSASRFLSTPFSNSRHATPSPSRSASGILRAATPTTILSYLNAASDPTAGLQDSKDASGLDWYVEGPGRRVGYDNLTAIDWIYEYSKERTRLRQLSTNSPGVLGQLRLAADASQIWWVLVATGLAVGGIAAGIDVASDWLGEIKTVLGGFVIRHFLGAWTLIIKSLGLCLAVASGMWLGKEGPLVHVACCCANVFMKLFDGINGNEARKRETLSAAAASGISVAFGAPIGGVLFSLEQLSYYFPDKTMWAAFVCAMVAAVTLHASDPFRTGKLVLFQVTYHNGWHAFELVPFAIIGIIGGLYGAMFIKLNMRVAAWRTSNSNPFLKRPVLEVVAVAVITALISYPITFLRAQSSELVEYLFAECVDLQDDVLGLCKAGIANTGVIFILLISALIGFCLAVVTFGLQIPAGILLPSMAVGALYGRVVGLIMEVWQRNFPNFIAFGACALEPDIPCITPGTYAVIGAASALAGATRMTVSIVVIMFELTGALTYVLPIMVAVMLSKWVGDAFGKRDIYESWIHFQGYPFLDNKDDAPVPDVPVAQVMTRFEDLVCITAVGHTIDSLQDLLREHRFRGFPVVNESREATLLGYISRTELQFALHSATSSSRSLPSTTSCYFQHQPLADPSVTLDLRPWMDQTPITLSSRSSLQLTNDMFQKLGLRYIAFVDRGVLAGLMTKKDLWLILNEGEEGRVGHGAGVLREELNEREDERGLLGHSRDFSLGSVVSRDGEG